MNRPVGNVWALVDQRIDYTSQREQALVYQTRLGRSLILRSTPLDVLAASQVDQVEFSGTDVLLARICSSFDIHGDGEDGVASRTQVIALGGSNLTPVAALPEQPDPSRRGINISLFHTLHQCTAILAFLALIFEYLQLAVLLRGEQVPQLLIVQFNEGAFHGTLRVLEFVEQGVQHARDNSRVVR